MSVFVFTECVCVTITAPLCPTSRRYLKIQIENRGKFLEALDYIRDLPFLVAEKNLLRYGHALVANCPDEVRLLLLVLLLCVWLCAYVCVCVWLCAYVSLCVCVRE